MAGVGLELRKLQKNRSYLSTLCVFGYSLALSVGPWLATIFAVGFISLIGLKWLGYEDMTFFTSTILYIFAGSLILTGPLFMVFSRYLADRSFMGQLDQRKALLFVQGTVPPVAALLGFAGALYYVPRSMGNTWIYQLSATLLFTSLVGLWCTVAYLDFQKRFVVSFYTFVVGSLLSVGLAFLLRGHGHDGLLGGYALGSTLSWILLLFIALRNHAKDPSEKPFRPMMLMGYTKTFSSLLWIGLLYNVGTWIDKFVLWIGMGITVPGSRLVIFPPYDIATFMSYLIMMPAVSYFLVMVETRFYYDYREYLDHLEKSSLEVVDQKREKLWLNLKQHINNLFELELVVGVVGVIVGGWLLHKVGLDDDTIQIFRVLTGAAFFQVLFWTNLILLLYFEFRTRALIATLFFLTSNILLTSINFLIFPEWGLGWGYFTTGLLSTTLSWAMLRHGIRNLNRHIFFIHSAMPAHPA